jgi:ABC-2 type transport system permease protein
MRNAFAIARKELAIYFTTAWAYVVATAMICITAFFFMSALEQFRIAQEAARVMGWGRIPPEFKNLTDGVVVPLVGAMVVINLFVAPFLSMRLFAEEKRHRTFELLMTAPVRPWEIIVGKYLGGLTLVVSTIGLTIVFPLVLAAFGSSESGSALEWSTVLLGYFGLLLLGATCLAVGMFISALTESQMLAAMLTFAVLLPWYFASGLAQRADEPLRSIVSHVSIMSQLENLMRGVLDIKALVFFASVILLSLFLTHRTVEAQRWA